MGSAAHAKASSRREVLCMCWLQESSGREEQSDLCLLLCGPTPALLILSCLFFSLLWQHLVISRCLREGKYKRRKECFPGRHSILPKVGYRNYGLADQTLKSGLLQMMLTTSAAVREGIQAELFSQRFLENTALGHIYFFILLRGFLCFYMKLTWDKLAWQKFGEMDLNCKEQWRHEVSWEQSMD